MVGADRADARPSAAASACGEGTSPAAVDVCDCGLLHRRDGGGLAPAARRAVMIGFSDRNSDTDVLRGPRDLDWCDRERRGTSAWHARVAAAATRVGVAAVGSEGRGHL